MKIFQKNILFLLPPKLIIINALFCINCLAQITPSSKGFAPQGTESESIEPESIEPEPQQDFSRLKTSQAPAFPRTCNFEIKSIQASGKSKPLLNSLVVPAELEEQKEQLKTLPFKEFKLIDQLESTLKINQLERISVKGLGDSSHMLKLVFNNLNAKKADLTVDWEGPRGEKMLATRLRINNSRSMVLGTGSKESEESLILSLKPSCSED